MKHAAFFEGLRHCLLPLTSYLLPLAFYLLPLTSCLCHAASSVDGRAALGLPRAWQVNAGAGRVVDLPAAFHGEEIALRADFVDPSGQPFVLPEGDWKLYFQTNGMDRLYFGPFPATAVSNSVSAVFSPTNDPGAAQITGYLSLPGSIYHAAFRLRFLPSPGATPNALPLPAPTIDFATTEILNAPYYTKDETLYVDWYETNGMIHDYLMIDDLAVYNLDVTNFTLRNSPYATTNDLASAKWPWSSITNAPTTWAWSAITGKPTTWAWSAITGKPTTWAWSDITGKPTTWAWSAITGAPTQWAWSSITNKPAWIGDTKPTYTPNEIFALAENWIGVQGNAGRIIKILAQTIGGVIMGGYQVTASTLNDNNTTTYALNGVAVKRSGVNTDYLWDDSDYGVARHTNITAAASATLDAAMLASQSNVVAAIEFILSAETVATSVYTGVSRDTELHHGKMILFRLGSTPSGNWTLNLTLADGSTTGAKPTYISGTTQLAKRYTAGQIVPLVYRADVNDGAWYAVADYDTDTNYYDRNLVTYCRAAEAIAAPVLCVGTTNGYVQVSTNVTFDVNLPILFNITAQSAGEINSNSWYSNYNSINLGTTWTGWTGDATYRRRPVFLIGSYNPDDETFTIDPECPFSFEPRRPCFPLGWYNANANASFCFLPGQLMRDDIPTFTDVEREITIRLATTNACISVSNGVTRIFEVDGDTRTLKWEWNAALTNAITSLESQMPRKIEDTRTWANFAASGSTNLFPGAVSLDRPSTYFASSNVVWTVRDGFAVMTSHLPATASGNASQFRIGIDADDWFGMEVTAAYLVDAHSDSFDISQPNPTRTATITTDYDAAYVASPPVVYFTESLAEPFSQLNSGVSWAHDSSAGVSTVTIQGLTGAAGFFSLKKWEAGGAIFRSTLPILPEGYRVEKNGSYVGTVQPDSIITITIDGHTYRLIAEEVP